MSGKNELTTKDVFGSAFRKTKDKIVHEEEEKHDQIELQHKQIEFDQKSEASSESEELPTANRRKKAIGLGKVFMTSLVE